MSPHTTEMSHPAPKRARRLPGRPYPPRVVRERSTVTQLQRYVPPTPKSRAKRPK